MENYKDKKKRAQGYIEYPTDDKLNRNPDCNHELSRCHGCENSTYKAYDKKYKKEYLFCKIGGFKVRRDAMCKHHKFYPVPF